ncbi:hypothetical protein LEP1GSC032_4541 [Leptospira interrogans str. 2002000631]|nr:hypothetical protein LEP1GSC027_3188 [Leptospira interrogans str. 2002000624]EKQ38360.1 hypothetical protein LEP1GSC025_3833 [Leptospira interrogans str. 2002000621]EKQ47477.1 hypothetical protein LEP1GSC026_4581 [Leptospira interrogans str. 2002000623]EMJ76337.1 hypothetical protein LEP1GSC033_0246 [Leptospira interrogans str. 2002000632]EMJ77404.1 hypothetical protein LEP1GSC032_4541 [Leptospira interrogans str. 2002000631]
MPAHYWTSFGTSFLTWVRHKESIVYFLKNVVISVRKT